MSLFSLMRDFNNEDSFFGGPMDSMRRMESMMDNMMAPFGGMFGRQRAHQSQNHAGMGNALMPFGFGGSLFPNMDDMFAPFNQIGTNPNSHSFVSHSVTTYTTDETGRPQVYQASSSTRTAPGGVKETRRSVQDTQSGLQEMAIGHHLNERGHVIEKKKYRYTGEEEENHEFINLDDDEAEQFDQEWQNRAQTFNSRPMRSMLEYDSPRRARTPDNFLAITDGSSSVLNANETEEEACIIPEKVPKKMRPEITNVEQSTANAKKKSGKHKRKHGHGSSSHKNATSHIRSSPYQ